jgi:hypothetical protein
MAMRGLYKVYNVPAVNYCNTTKYEIIYYEVQYQCLVQSGAYISS